MVLTMTHGTPNTSKSSSARSEAPARRVIAIVLQPEQDWYPAAARGTTAGLAP